MCFPPRCEPAANDKRVRVLVALTFRVPYLRTRKHVSGLNSADEGTCLRVRKHATHFSPTFNPAEHFRLLRTRLGDDRGARCSVIPRAESTRVRERFIST